MKKLITTLLGALIGIYFLSLLVFTPYFNWQYAKHHGFIKWLLLGEIVATAKSAVWPYYIFFAKAASPAQPRPEAKIAEYTDNEYGYAFQFPSDWKIEKNPPPGEAGETRAIIRHPAKPMHVMAIVGNIGKTVTKRQFESSLNRDAMVEAMMELSVEQVYKKVSRDIEAERMIVSEKQMQPSDAGIKFYISTAHIKGNTAILVAGTHILPYEKPYMVTFMMITPVNRTATKDNETITRVFNSFHVLGERPIR